jgi:hypothetical protein
MTFLSRSLMTTTMNVLKMSGGIAAYGPRQANVARNRQIHRLEGQQSRIFRPDMKGWRRRRCAI